MFVLLYLSTFSSYIYIDGSNLPIKTQISAGGISDMAEYKNPWYWISDMAEYKHPWYCTITRETPTYTMRGLYHVE